METISQLDWHPSLLDPTGKRSVKPRTAGMTMVIDKGLGQHAFEDLVESAGPHIDMIKIGFGTSPLYPQRLLQRKIEIAKSHDILIMPGGTFLEVAVWHKAVDDYFHMIANLGFDAIEVSDGTIEIDRQTRNELIKRGIGCNLKVFTEYGKKCFGSSIEMEQLLETVIIDLELGASLVTIEGRESGVGVGIYDAQGNCKEDEVQEMLRQIPDPSSIMWEAPLKSQQVYLLNSFGPDIHLGNIAPQDIMSLEALRRGLRSDTFFSSLEREKG